MASLHSQIDQIKEQLTKALAHATTPALLEQVRIDFLSRSGAIATLMKCIATLSVDEKKVFGPLLNELKKSAELAYQEKEQALTQATLAEQHARTQGFDVTAYKTPEIVGGLHIYTKIIEHIENIVTTMGYAIVDGPELETEFNNFTALNIPDNHPARDMHDTFWLTLPGTLMRTHTSTAQVHAMKTQPLPLAISSIGRCYRNEATDASHDFMFTQAELLFIDQTASVSQLLATAQTFLQKLFEKEDLAIRVRPGYFPFVEPGIEIDASCPFCTSGCSTCKYTTWIELLGSGLVHPNVLRCCGIDPEKYSGFAFGMGLERVAMIKYGINDIRLFHSYKYQFLKQF
jgi:phenylalanyl-tRNA synthetase alpha chain